jgi:FMN phosphatase YigB (HAD superfamily)
MNPQISTLIVDLDNTLFDWVEQWYHSFNAMLEKIQALSGIDRATLISEIKAIHEHHGTSEYSFLIEELPCLQAKHPGEDLRKIYDEAIQAYRSQRKKYLRLYPSVLPTLSILKSKGVRIVAYTESLGFYSSYRIRTLGLDGIIDTLYSPMDHDLPERMSSNQVRSLTAADYSLQATIHKFTPKDALKPNAEVLHSILRDLSALPAACIYVGDSLMKDIAMANDVGIFSVHAKYGEAHKTASYELLKEVTHWPIAHVKTEETLRPNDVIPKYVLRASFSEIFSHFQFSSFETQPNNEIRGQQLSIWEKTIDVQQHFNDLSLKVRGLAITVLGAILSAVAFSLKEQVKGESGWATVPPLVPALLAIAITSWLAFWLMDQFWYHRFLKGAVNHGLNIEEKLQTELPVIGLTGSIGEASASTVLGIKVRSNAKLTIFYVMILGILVAAFIVSIWLSLSKQESNHASLPKEITKSNCCSPSTVSVQCVAVGTESQGSSTSRIIDAPATASKNRPRKKPPEHCPPQKVDQPVNSSLTP